MYKESPPSLRQERLADDSKKKKLEQLWTEALEKQANHAFSRENRPTAAIESILGPNGAEARTAG